MAPRSIITAYPQGHRRYVSPPISPSTFAPDANDILAELGLRADDSASSAGDSSTGFSTIDSGVSVNGGGSGTVSGAGGRRRRRRNRNRNGNGNGHSKENSTQTAHNGSSGNISIDNKNSHGGNFNRQTTVVMPRQGGERDEKPVRLQIGLNLDVDLELKAKLKGDICLSLVVERKFSKRESIRVKPNWKGEVDVKEMFHMRLGKFSFRQRWIDREVSESLTLAIGVSLAMGGFVAGFAASKWLC
ncbi:hypothetical protein CORC01_12892 [Colletotrichum orchidophilum]|uniref:Uncharacterized protein n=1 Tax=Colletotrichum orchidophilum TaxID=1209926 RepID=A0A1G4ARM4_9PEZI|nr:uncharacterized protein CORC01_12892 [Colletotrichum orchidophilum]OHE91818.1 hypothetical protein CORC01_12892 [Colletotrichum orchidophilum]